MEFLDILLWISLFVLIAGAILPKKYGYKVAAAGWVLFGLRWGLSTPGFYFVEHNILYTVLCVLSVPLTLYAAFLMIKDQRESLMVITKSVAISSIFYFPFAYFPWLGDWIMGVTATITVSVLRALGENAALDGNIITFKGQAVEIILACTAIQSMAIFVGVVGCIKASADRTVKAFIISVPVIYLLNIIRNVFVISAFGNQWFQLFPDTIISWTGEPAGYTSFFWAHNVFAETGSLIALIVISYAVISLLPETLIYLQDIFKLLQIENIKKSLRGQKVIEVTPLQTKK
ncbi:MAG TPA: archaeosortase A [Methanocellaceae archaeon]